MRTVPRHTEAVQAATQTASVYVVDDDPSIQRALVRLLSSAGMHCMAFASIDALLVANLDGRGHCVIADVRIGHDDGLRIPKLLAERGLGMPVIVLTAVDTDDIRGRALQAGAVAFFRKPVDDQALIDAIRWALGQQAEK
jgi:FixJ family two-component response regulator